MQKSSMEPKSVLVLLAEDDADDRGFFIEAENLNGYITAKSQPGKGSVFSIYLPVEIEN